MTRITPQSEAAIQADYFEWVDLHAGRFPVLSLIHSLPNEGKSSHFAGWQKNVTGRRKGIPDVHVPMPSNGNNGLWIEFKSEKGRVKPEQAVWMDLLRKHGHIVVVCRSWVEAANLTIEYLNLPLEKL